MAGKGTIQKTAYLTVTLLAVAGSLISATYAWFTTNRVVETTEKVTGRTDTMDVKLLLSTKGGASFKGDTEAVMDVVNQAQADSLMPVTTYDLKSFLYCPYTAADDMATCFVELDSEQYYFHGRIYLMAEVRNLPEETRLALYLDEAPENGGGFLQNGDGYMVNAARLGLVFDNQDSYILRFSEENNPEEYMIENTVIDGEVVSGSFVLTKEGDSIRAVQDPSVKYTDYLLGADTDAMTAKPLIYMEPNREYMLDIYFYLEGCDPDCSDITEMETVDFHLGFYGVVEG
ncbi:MAG: hypothetical protein ACI4U1_04700 [Anaerovoracaceae bacterium]